MNINALWIDDQSNDGFVDLAYEKGINIKLFENVDDGIAELISPHYSYDAIILDANCVSHSNGSLEPKISALQYALMKITDNHIDIPWFVYSGGGFEGEDHIDTLVEGCEKGYHKDKRWYKKPLEMDLLFNKIIEVARNSDLYKLRNRYPEIFEFWHHHKELVEILKALDTTPHTDVSVFNKIRCQLELALKYCHECGVLLKYDNSKISEHRYALANPVLSANGIVPVHVQSVLTPLVKMCNECSHPLPAQNLVNGNEAPYLIQSTIYEFLNVIHWLRSLPVEAEDRKRLRERVKKLLETQAAQDDKASQENKTLYEGKVWTVCKDERGIYHCGKCKLAVAASSLDGRKVKLVGVQDNLHPDSKKRYPLYARFEKIEADDNGDQTVINIKK